MPKPAVPTPAAPPHTRRGIPWLLIRHVGREYMTPLVCCLTGFMVLFALGELFDVLNDLVSSQASGGMILRYFLLRQPGALTMVLPISLLLSAGYLVSNLGRTSELTAIRASGISMPRVFAAIWVTGILFSVLSFYFAEQLAPHCSSTADQLMDQMTSSQSSKARQQMGVRLAYRNRTTLRDWFFTSFNPGGVQTGVLVKQFREDRRVAWEARAVTATYEKGVWTLHHAIRIEYDPESMLPLNDGELLAELRIVEDGEPPTTMLNSMRPVESLNIREMRHVLESQPDLPLSTRRIFQTTIWRRLFFPFACLGAAMAGVGLSIHPQGGSRLRGFASAIALLLVYYLVLQFFGLLSKRGMIPPAVAGIAPTLLLLGWSARELWRKR